MQEEILDVYICMLGPDNCPVPANTITLLDQCSFEKTNICGMIQNEDDDAEWVQTSGRQPAAPEPHAALSSLCCGSLCLWKLNNEYLILIYFYFISFF